MECAMIGDDDTVDVEGTRVGIEPHVWLTSACKGGGVIVDHHTWSSID